MNEKSGSVAVRGIGLELRERHEVGREVILEPLVVDHAGARRAHRLGDVDLPGLAVVVEPVEDRLGVVVLDELLTWAGSTRNPDDVAAVQNDRLGKVWDGHLAEPVVEHPEPAGQPVEHRDLLGGEPGHDLRVLLVGGLAAQLGGEGADVVGDEAVHRRRLTRRRRVVRRGDLRRRS